MCDPATLMIAATVASAASAGVGALSANAQANYQAKIAERNAGLEREAARQEQENTRQAALQHYRQVSKLKGQQIVGAAANGVGVDFGTAGDVLADTEMLSREDVNRIYQQGFQNVRGRDIQASNYMGEASAQRQAGKGALIKGAFDMGSTVLGGVSQYKGLKSGMGAGAKLPKGRPTSSIGFG
jgi:hypothetical protein